MNRANKALIVAVVATLGAWGCAKGPTGNGADRAKVLEVKVGKLEEDFRAAAAARDQVRQKLASAEDQRSNLQKEVIRLKAVVKERDELRQQVTTRTGERDALQVQYDQFRKAIRELLGQAEASNGPGLQQPVTSATTTLVPGKS